MKNAQKLIRFSNNHNAGEITNKYWLFFLSLICQPHPHNPHSVSANLLSYFVTSGKKTECVFYWLLDKLRHFEAESSSFVFLGQIYSKKHIFVFTNRTISSGFRVYAVHIGSPAIDDQDKHTEHWTNTVSPSFGKELGKCVCWKAINTHYSHYKHAVGVFSRGRYFIIIKFKRYPMGARATLLNDKNINAWKRHIVETN